MQLEENGISDSVLLSFPVRKESASAEGFNIALWALWMRSVTSDLSVMVGPNATVWGMGSRFPSEPVLKRKETLHSHGVLVRSS